MKNETTEKRSKRIISQLKAKYPGKDCYDLDGRGMHFVCEVEPVNEHPEYDRAVEVIIQNKPHKHLKMTQQYTILLGKLDLYVNNQKHHLFPGDKFTVSPNSVHWAISQNECWVEIYSTPGWTKADHIVI